MESQSAIDPQSATESHEYRIDELARLAGTTVRNVRAYQDRGLLPAPRRAGRVGLYAESHLARLRVIGEMLGRGYTLGNIAELIAGWEQGRDLSELLGLETALIAPWSDEEASWIARDDVVDLLGSDAAGELLEEAQRLGLLQIEGERVRVDNPRLLEGAVVLMTAGVPTPAVLQLGAYLTETIDQIAAHYVELIVSHLLPVGTEDLSAVDLPRLTGVIQQLRPLAKQVLDAELALALQRRIQVELGDRMGRMLPGGGAAAAAG
jgi:DNA-binding transcriptional MerR regulator